MQHSRAEREQRQHELNSAYFVLSGAGGTVASYGYAMRAIDHHLTGDSHAHWQQKYERRLEELRTSPPQVLPTEICGIPVYYR